MALFDIDKRHVTQYDDSGVYNGDTGEPRLPACTVAKITAYVNVSPQMRLSLDIDNVFDKTHYASHALILIRGKISFRIIDMCNTFPGYPQN